MGYTEADLEKDLEGKEYEYGFVSDFESDRIDKGLNEDVVRLISNKREEPEWLLEFRLSAYRHWLTMEEPDWAHVKYEKPNFQEIVYYSAPKPKKKLNSLDEVDPELKTMYDKLGISVEEQMRMNGIAIDVIVDSDYVGRLR